MIGYSDSAKDVGVVAASWHQTVMDGLLTSALAALSDADVSDPEVVRELVALADRAGAQADVDQAIESGKNFMHFHHTAYSIGAVYAELGDLGKAQEWIEIAANDGFPNYTFFEQDIHLEPLRKVPEFRAFLTKLRQEANAALRAKDFETAAAAFKKITTADPKDGQAWQVLGYSLHVSGKLDEALPAHKKAVVKDYVASTQGKLTLHFLPGYAPDLNPDELVWSHAKRTGNARRPLRAGEKLEVRVRTQLADIGNRPALVRSFFKHPDVAYISDL